MVFYYNGNLCEEDFQALSQPTCLEERKWKGASSKENQEPGDKLY